MTPAEKPRRLGVELRRLEVQALVGGMVFQRGRSYTAKIHQELHRAIFHQLIPSDTVDRNRDVVRVEIRTVGADDVLPEWVFVHHLEYGVELLRHWFRLNMSRARLGFRKLVFVMGVKVELELILCRRRAQSWRRELPICQGHEARKICSPRTVQRLFQTRDRLRSTRCAVEHVPATRFSKMLERVH
eukprot:9503903-Pyramimonas_sp.AAC.1